MSIPCGSWQVRLSSSIGPKTACYDRALTQTQWCSYCQHDNNATALSKVESTKPGIPPWSLQADWLVDNNEPLGRTKRRVAKPDFHIENCWVPLALA